MSKLVNPKEVAASLKDFWSPLVIGEVDDSYIKVAKLKGTLVWHSHDNEDEVFMVLEGCLQIEMESETVNLGPGDLYVVPKGVRHNPFAEKECLVMLFERKSTAHTGNEVTDKTRTIEEQTRSI